MAVFLLAHQDDEFGVFEQIHLSVTAGKQVQVWYLTTGVPAGGDPCRRNRESERVLRSFGVLSSDITFAGEELGISDGTLCDAMSRAAAWLARRLGSITVDSVYVTAWEGGHPDHDSLCTIAANVCAECGLGDRLQQFHLYNGYRCPGPWFRVLSPLAANGPVSRSRIPWLRRLRYLRHCLSYSSQWRSWMGLFPFMAVRYALHGTQDLQPVLLERLAQKPHEGRLYYEKRRFSDWETVRVRASAFAIAGRHPRNSCAPNPAQPT